MLYGVVTWGALAIFLGGMALLRSHSSAINRAPLPALSVQLPASQARQWMAFPHYRNVVPVLNYHSVGGPASDLTTSRTLFAKQMRALKDAGFHALTLQQYDAFVSGNTDNLPDRPILLTFDDGRRDAYRATNTILREDNFHATEFVVPGWVTAHPSFSLSWTEIKHMAGSGVWNVQEDFGYGHNYVPINKAGKHGAAFGNLAYVSPHNGNSGHLETFPEFRKRFQHNMAWGEQQLSKNVPGYRPLAMAIPLSDYGQISTNDKRIPPYVLSWLDHHYGIVFGGDYLDKGQNRSFQVPGRFSQSLAYRLTMGPAENLSVLRCRLLDYVRNTPIWKERFSCFQGGKAARASGKAITPATLMASPRGHSDHPFGGGGYLALPPEDSVDSFCRKAAATRNVCGVKFS